MDAATGELTSPRASNPWQDDSLHARSLAPDDKTPPGGLDVTRALSRNGQVVNPTFSGAKIAEHSR
jgi:hypothetical protein